MKFFYKILTSILLTLFVSQGIFAKSPSSAHSLKTAGSDYYLLIIQEDTADALEMPRRACEEIAEGEETTIGRLTIDRFVKENREFRSFFKGEEGLSMQFTGEKKIVGEDGESYLVDGHPEEGTLLANFDLNPGERWKLDKTKSVAEEAELLKVLRKKLSSHSQPGTKQFKKNLISLSKNKRKSKPAEIQIDLIRDYKKNQDFSVITVNLRTKKGTSLATLRAILRLGQDRVWQVLWLETAEGCADCDNQPLQSRFVNFGDLSRDGALNFVFATSGYESWGYDFFRWDGRELKQSELGGSRC